MQDTYKNCLKANVILRIALGTFLFNTEKFYFCDFTQTTYIYVRKEKQQQQQKSENNLK